MLPIYTPTEFANILAHEQRPVLAGCLDHESLLEEQVDVLKYINRTFQQRFSVCLLNPEYLSEFNKTYAIAGTPSYILFYLGKEKTRFIGFADALNLMNIMLVDDYSELDELEPSLGHKHNAVHPVPHLSGLFRSWKRQ